MRCPEKSAPKRRRKVRRLKEIVRRLKEIVRRLKEIVRRLKEMRHSDSVSAKEDIVGQRRVSAKPRQGNRTALYLRVSTADQKPDLQDDGLRRYAARRPRDCRGYCDVA